MISGKKTYIFAAVIALASGAKYLGWIDESLFQLVAGLCGAGAAASIRAGGKSDAEKAATQAVNLAADCQEKK